MDKKTFPAPFSGNGFKIEINSDFWGSYDLPEPIRFNFRFRFHHTNYPVLSNAQFEHFSKEHHDVLHSIRTSRIIFPILLGLVAVSYLFWKHFDPKEFSRIQWTSHTVVWIGIAAALSVIWHLSYAYRLRALTKKEFSWWKCIELIFIWEFSSAVSPTSLGGSAVAFFVLAQEKLSAARTATIVMYTIILDSLFLLITVPILYFIFGSSVMRPGADSFVDTGAWGVYFLITYSLMLSYSSLIYYGVFVSPHQLERLMGWLTNNRLLRRYHEKALAFGRDLETASLGLKKEPLIFHLKAIGATIAAWTLRFLIISALIIAFLPNLPLDFSTQFQLYARLEVMFFVIAFSPTPGGAGLIDLLFGGFLTDYVSNPTQSAMISTLWRLMSYYVYLFAGALIVPNWIRQRINERRERQMEIHQKEEGEERPHA